MAATPTSEQCPEFAESVWIAQLHAKKMAIQQQEEINKQLLELKAACLDILMLVEKAEEIIGRIDGNLS